MSYKKMVIGSLLFSSLLFTAVSQQTDAAAMDSETNPAAAVTADDPTVKGTPVAIENPDFSAAELGKDTQMYKGEVVKTEDGKSVVRIGQAEPKDGTSLDKALWKGNYGKGMVNKVIHVEPNTTYRVSVDVKALEETTGESGLLVLEGGSVKGELNSEYTGYKGDGKWHTETHEITTGPRTSELYAFVYIKNSGETEATNFTAEKLDSPKVDEVSSVDQKVTAEGDFPVTVPSIQSFEKSEGTGYELNRIKETIYTDDASKEKADYLASEMQSEGLVKAVDVKSLDEAADTASGIVMRVGETGLASDDPAKPVYDSYTININNGKIDVAGDAVSGVQYGSMTLLQAFKQQFTLPNGVVKDYTDQKIRGLQVDTGRHYWSIDWLKNEIEHMAGLKQNTLQLRLKDNEGIRYESDIDSDYVDRKGGFYTKEEVKDLVAYAKKFNVSIIPEIDFPGHSTLEATTKANMQLAGSACLDISKQEVRDYIYSIYKEAADLFETDIIHIGGDEYFQSNYPGGTTLADWAKKETGNDSATEYDAFKLCMNEMADRLIKDGYKVSMWNDNIQDVDGAVPLDRRIIVDIWAGTIYGSKSAGDFAKAGFSILSSSSSMYHDTWPYNDKLDRPLPEDYLWKKWDRFKFSGGFMPDQEVKTTQSLGQFFPIWDDAHGYASDYIVTQSLFPRFAVFAQREWGAPDPCTDYAAFETQAYYLGSTNDYVDQTATVNYNQKDVDKVLSAAKEKAATDEAQQQLNEMAAAFAKIENPTGKDYTNYVYQLMFLSQNGFAYQDAGQLEIPVDSLNLGAGGIQVVKTGKTIDLQPAVSPEDATNKTISYSFSKDGIVSIDENGVLTAIKPGMVKVQATAGDKTATVTIRVTQ